MAADIPQGRRGRAWPYRAVTPQRFQIDEESYRRIGGSIDLDPLVKGFMGDRGPDGDMTRFYGFCLVFEQLVKEQVPGDLLELGAYQGRTATLLAQMARRLGRTAYVLDTFEGFDARDMVAHDQGAKVGTFSDTSLEAVRALVGEDSVRFVKGYFPESARDLPTDATYCLVHIDCDLYAPIMSALEYFYPRMAPGGFIIVHDYSSPSWAGAERAVDEFFADKPEGVIPMPDGAGSVMIRRMRSLSSDANWLVQRRAALLGSTWLPAGNNVIRDLLGEGWRRAENWGLWGVGERHELHLALPADAPDTVLLEADVHAFLAGTQTEQRITVRQGSQPVAEWTFNAQANRGVRSVPLTRPGPGLVPVTLTFHPAALGIPAELSATAKEQRPLGLAMHRLRIIRPG